MSVRMTRMALANFRGVRDAVDFDLDADIVLLRGDNGSGKTSFSDGIFWLIFGDLPHLRERVRATRRSHDYILSRYATGPARVSLEVRRGDATYRIERVGDSKNSTLSVVQLSPQERTSQIEDAFGTDSWADFLTSFQTWGVLRQDAVRLVLDTAGSALHERLSSVVGLADLTRFREACRSALKTQTAESRASNEDVSRAKARVEESEIRLAQIRATRRARMRETIGDRISSLAALSTSSLQFKTADVDDEETLVSLGRDISALADLAASAADAYEGLLSAEKSYGTSAAALRGELDLLRASAEDLHATISAQRQLASAALLLLGEHCPVCDQQIDVAHVRERLDGVLTSTTNSEAHAERSVGLIAEAERRWRDALAGEAASARAAELLRAARSNLLQAVDASPYVHIAGAMREPEEYRALERSLDQARFTLRRVYAEVHAETASSEAESEAELTANKARLDEQTAASKEIEKNLDAARRLDKASQAAAEKIVASLLQRLEPSFAEVFDRLSPHPTFSRLRAKQDVYYNKNHIVPEVFDAERDVTANPLLVFSEGQLNTVALSYFLGLALNSDTPGLSFMVMDDPLQAMDVLAVLGFADLCRRLRHERQLVITTHDRRYADLLIRKLAPRESTQATIVHELSAWSESGPSLSTRREEFGSPSTVLRSVAS